jgi:hypothetical protein
VPNWSFSRNYKNIWNSTKDSVTTGMFVTRRLRGAKPQVKGAQGSVGHTLSWFRPRLDGYVHTSVYKSIPCPRVSRDWEEWLADHVDGCPAVHHLQTNSIKSVKAPLDLYIRIPMVELTHTTLFLYFSTCTGFGLVAEAQAKPYQELRVESSRVFARALEVVSEIGEFLYPYLSL